MSSPKKKMSRTDREIAELPYPVQPVHPFAAERRRYRPIPTEGLKPLPLFLSPAGTPTSTPPPPARPVTPERRPAPSLPETPPSVRRKKDPYACLFIPRRPPPGSPLKAPTERGRVASSPYPSSSPRSSPMRQRVGNRVVSGPAPGLFNRQIPQQRLFPEESSSAHPDIDPRREFVYFSKFPDTGCLLFGPDAVEKGPLNVPGRHVRLAFQWGGYEKLGSFTGFIDLGRYREPFDARLAILSKIKDMFEEFRTEYRENMERMKKPDFNVLAYGNSEIRVTRLELRTSNFYQVMFTVPDEMRR